MAQLIERNARTSAFIQKPQLIVNVEDFAMIGDLKKAISMMRGVTKITVPNKKSISAYEQSLRDLDEGRVNSYASVDDFFAKMGQ